MRVSDIVLNRIHNEVMPDCVVMDFSMDEDVPHRADADFELTITLRRYTVDYTATVRLQRGKAVVSLESVKDIPARSMRHLHFLLAICENVATIVQESSDMVGYDREEL